MYIKPIYCHAWSLTSYTLLMYNLLHTHEVNNYQSGDNINPEYRQIFMIGTDIGDFVCNGVMITSYQKTKKTA